MKPRFYLEDYDGQRYAMHCNTEEKANAFLEFLDKHGRCWSGGTPYHFLNNNFGLYKSSTCYNFNMGTFGSEGYYIANHFTVLEYDDFSWDEHEHEPEMTMSFEEMINEETK